MSTYTTIQAQTDDNQQIPLQSTPEGHLEVAIHGPINPFGSVHTESLTPVFQSDAVYGVNQFEVTTATGLAVGSGANSAAATASANYFVASTGTTQYSFASLQSRRRLRYRAGQGVVGRFAGRFSAPAANSIVVAGFGTAESGVYFGYNGTSFGILHSTGGVREIQTLTVTTASTATNNYVVTLPSGQAVNVTATNNNSTIKTAYEISRGTYPGWKAEQRGSTVVFIADSVGPKAAISFAQTGAGTPAAVTVAETVAGVAGTDTWVPQTSWNGDKLDGSGYSDFTLDPSKGNVYQIGFQYLGAGPIFCSVEVPAIDGNNATWVLVHTFNFPNSLTSTTLSQPSFPFTMSAYSAGSTTDVSVRISSFAGFIEGKMRLTGPRMTYTDTSTAVSTTSYYALLTIRNDRVFSGRANQSVIHLLSFGGAHDDTTPVTLFLIRNATLVGTPNFTQHSATSSTYVDTAATTCTFTDNEQVVFSLPLGASGNGLVDFGDDVTLQPGETITIAAQAVFGTATYTIASLNTREDQ